MRVSEPGFANGMSRSASTAAKLLRQLRPLLVGHHVQRDLDPGHARHRGHGTGDVPGDRVAKRATGDGEEHLDPHLSAASDVDGLDHSEVGDGTLDLGVVDRRERGHDLLGRREGTHATMLRPALPNYDWGVTTEVSRDRVTPEQLEVWRSFLRAHSLIVRRLETDLMDRHGIPLAWYDVLARLVEADEHRLRMSDFADRVMLSPSGLTRLVDRLVEAGLLCREPSENDARGSYAVLTDQGYERLRSATGTHLRGILDYVLSRFTDAELDQISRYLARLCTRGAGGAVGARDGRPRRRAATNRGRPRSVDPAVPRRAGSAPDGVEVPTVMLTVAATASRTNAPTTRARSDGRTCWGRATVRGPVESKPRASMAKASRVPRRTAPTRSVNTVPPKSRAWASALRPASTPRARRAIRMVRHSLPISGSRRRAASEAYAKRAGTRAFWTSESARSVGSTVSRDDTPGRLSRGAGPLPPAPSAMARSPAPNSSVVRPRPR